MSKSVSIVNQKPMEWMEVEVCIQKAASAFDVYRHLSPSAREIFLRRIADELAANRQQLIATCATETHLPQARLDGELNRTINQIHQFADLLREGSWVNAIIDTGIPDRTPLPRPDVRQIQIPLGPVCVYGASNFPFAFSVAGGDTISALAAGCPVLYKVHPSQPQTAQLTAACIARAIHETAVPEGVFASLWLATTAMGLNLVKHPLVKAVGFTGSYGGGKALYNAVQEREVPIPVYAEMGSVNPVFLLPGHLIEAGTQTAARLAASNVLGSGQFCTNPGLLVLLRSEAADNFLKVYAAELQKQPVHRMLNARIYQGYEAGIQQLKAAKGAHLLTNIPDVPNKIEQPIPAAFTVNAIDFFANELFSKEYFGPASIVVLANDAAEMLQVAERLEGQLTASLWCAETDINSFSGLFDLLEQKVGRLIVDAVPTGVEVCDAMIHGGPFPATMDGRSTSVGTQAIYRFTRAISYQNYPQDLLPEALRDNNVLAIWRTVNNELTKDSILS